MDFNLVCLLYADVMYTTIDLELRTALENCSRRNPLPYTPPALTLGVLTIMATIMGES